MRIITTLFCILLLFKALGQPCSMQGTYKIGPGGNYTTIAAALNAIRTNGLGGPVILETKTNYTNISEGLLSFANIPCATATNTVTLRPEIGSTNVRIFSNGTVFLLGNSKYVIIDGRPGGTGSTSQLTIDGVNTTNSTVLFQSNGTDNIIQYAKITSITASATSGAVAFLSGSNNNNIIRNCTITGNSNGHPLICVYAESSTLKNINNKIENCNITRYSSNNGVDPGIGVYLGKNNADWEISGNSFYCDNISPFWGSGESYAIFVNDTTSANSVTGNFIGGTAPQCGGLQSTLSSRFRGIIIAAGKLSYSSIQNNTIRNLRWNMSPSSSGLQDGFAAIHIISGKVNCGTTLGNNIGDMGQLSSIVSESDLWYSNSVTGILVGQNVFHTSLTDDTINIRNNSIGGIRCTPPSSSYSTKLRGIHVADQHSGFIDISGNTIGSPTLNNSLESKMNSDAEVVGIDYWVSTNGPAWLENSPVANLVSNNQIFHCNGKVTGIRVNGGKPQLINNIIANMSMSVNDNTVLSIVCIRLVGVVTGSLVKGNKLRNLELSPLQGSGLTGISIASSYGVEVSGNFIHNFQVLPQTLTGVITGIEGTSFVKKLNINNNMISLGVDSTGIPLTANNEYNGINLYIDTTNITHNSIYITGVCDRNANGMLLTKINTSACRVTNNIVMNVHAQSTSNPFSFNCAVNFDPIFTTNLGGLLMNNNLYNVSGLGSFIGSYNNARYSTLSSWQLATSNESNSLIGNPNFILPAADSLSTNLHIQSPTPADASGLAEPSITHDFDNQIRANFTPVDIGADAIIAGPVISSFVPASAGMGSTVTITGSGFTGATIVQFGNVAATSFTVINSTTITAIVGAGASGNVTVTTPGGTANRSGFTFIPGPIIISFAPSSGFTGTVITITGSNFTGATSVSFGGVPASSFTVVNASTITAIVGTGATGNITIITPGGTVSQTGFTFQTVTSIGAPGTGGSAELTVLPNPGSHKVVVRHPSSVKNSTLKIVDVGGKIIQTFLIPRNTSHTVLDVSAIASGAYTLIWISDKGLFWRNLLISH